METSREHKIKIVFLSVFYDVKHRAPLKEPPNWSLLDELDGRWLRLHSFIDKLWMFREIHK